MKSSLIIILIFLFFAKSQDSKDEKYQINTFIQENGIWDVLCEIKRYFGPDICIEVWKNFTQSPHCEEVVKVYITNEVVLLNEQKEEYLDKSELNTFLEERNYLTILKKALQKDSKVKDKSKIKIYLFLFLIFLFIIFLVLS